MSELLSFGQWVRRRRRAVDLTQAALADRVGCAAITIQKIELDERRPSRQIAERLAQALELTPEAYSRFLACARAERSVVDLPDPVRLTATMSPAAIQSLTPASAAPPSAYQPRKTNLQPYLSRFIGRAGEMKTLRELIAPLGAGCRLLTLLGPGGVGKTRLASELGASLQSDFPDGVWLVELAPVFDPAFAVNAIAATLGIREESGWTLLRRVTTVVAEKRLLLILDNCEHLVAECAALAESLLRACPQLSIIATSREALNISGETIFAVAPLSLPDLQSDMSPEQLQHYEGINLFVDRARAVHYGFQLTAENAGAVSSICRRLDGLPLAIELSAARIRSMTPEQMVSRLDQRFRLLIGGSRTAEPRHQTLQALIDWSYTLLSPSEKRLFRRMAVFSGGWTIAAAEEVCCRDDMEKPEVLEIIDQLIAKSLVVVEPWPGEQRYTLLESLREYALQRLSEADEIEALRMGHLRYYCTLAERAEPALHGPDQLRCLEELKQEHDNFRAALEWSLASGSPAALQSGLALAAALREFWFQKNHWTEARQWLERLLNSADAEPCEAQADRAYARCLCAAGFFAHIHSEMLLARANLERGMRLCEAAGDQHGVALALADLAWIDLIQGLYSEALIRLERSETIARAQADHLVLAVVLYRRGYTLFMQRDLARARAPLEQSLELFQQLAPVSSGVATALVGLAAIAMDQGAYAVSRDALERSRPIFEQLGNENGISMVWNALGELARIEGDYELAAAYYERSLVFNRNLGLVHDVATDVHNLAYIALHRGQCDAAEAQFKESLALWEQVADETRGRLMALAGLAAVAAVRSRQSGDDLHASQRAACLFGAVAALLALNQVSFTGADEQEYERYLALARSLLDAESFADAWSAGQTMTMEQALALSIEQIRAAPQAL